jgi:MFS family permease
MTPTIAVLLVGLALLLVGVGLLGTLLGLRAGFAEFSSIETGIVMAGYYVGYIGGTLLVPRVVRNVGHIRTFAALAAITATSSLAFGLVVDPLAWLPLRVVNGLGVVGIYMVVESWINEQSSSENRGRVFSIYMMSTLIALGAGQFLLLAGQEADLLPFALAAMLISIGVVPIAVTRVTEPQIPVAGGIALGALFRISPLGAVGVLGAGVVNGAFWGMTPVFGHAIALDALNIALLMSATILGGALLQWPIGHLSDRHDRRRVLIGVSLATAAVAALTTWVIDHGTIALLVTAAVYGGLMFALYSLSVAHTNDHLQPDQVLDATRGLLLLYGGGALMGPLLGGAAMQWAGPVGLPAMSAVVAALLGLYGLYRMTRRSPPPVEEQTEFVSLARTSPVAMEMHPDAVPVTDEADADDPETKTVGPETPRQDIRDGTAT